MVSLSKPRSLGVILYELFVGQPPFYTNNLVTLVRLIINDSVKYPDNMSAKFKDFLKGLLNKDPNRRLNWPRLLEHPFIQETDAEKEDRMRKTEKYNQWIGLNFDQIMKVTPVLTSRQEPRNSKKNTPLDTHVNDGLLFDQLDFEGEDFEENIDKAWADWLAECADRSKIPSLRKNTKLLEAILKALQTNVIDMQASNKLLDQFACCLKTIVALSSQTEDQVSSTDILKNKTIGQSLISKLKVLSKDKEPSEKLCKLLSCLLAAISHWAEAVYDPSEGLPETLYQSKTCVNRLITSAEHTLGAWHLQGIACIITSQQRSKDLWQTDKNSSQGCQVKFEFLQRAS
jgi:serine/threonine protein kinase